MQYKGLPFAATQFKLEDDDRTFVGYASTFGNIDAGGDTILKGAYKEALKTYGMPKMFFNHDQYSVPIGKWLKAAEDDHGLLLTGEFTPGNTQAEQVRAALKHGTVDSLSIGYSLKAGDYQETPTGRTIKRIARLMETSIVTFPMDGRAKIDLASVKFSDEIAGIQTIRDFEYFLRDAGNFSKGAAQALTARVKTLFNLRDAGDTGETKSLEAQILQRIEKLGS